MCSRTTYDKILIMSNHVYNKHIRQTIHDGFVYVWACVRACDVCVTNVIYIMCILGLYNIILIYRCITRVFVDIDIGVRHYIINYNIYIHIRRIHYNIHTSNVHHSGTHKSSKAGCLTFSIGGSRTGYLVL